MAASRIIQLPMSGRDRKHYVRQLRQAEQTYEARRREAEAAHVAADQALQVAHRLDCEAWTALQFIGGADAPSPSIADALHGGCESLEVRCPECNHTEFVDLSLVVWPRDRGVHTLRKALYCTPCQQTRRVKVRPDLVGLRARPDPEPSAPARRNRAR